MLMARQRLSARLHGCRPARYRAISLVLALAIAGVAVAACSSSSHGAAPRKVATSTSRPAHTAPGTAATSGRGRAISSPSATATPEQPGWTVVSRLPSGIAVDSHSSRRSNGDLVTVLRFHAGLVHYALHVGSIDPPTGGAALPADARPAIGAREHAQLDVVREVRRFGRTGDRRAKAPVVWPVRNGVCNTRSRRARCIQ